jgi:hypothetical protein
MNCNRPGCVYLKHKNSNTDGYCCIACKNNGSHGPKCQKIRAANKQRKPKLRAGPAPAISKISIYSWGSSNYGKYLIFNFKSAANSQRIVKMDYQLLSGNTVLDSGSVPYLFTNSQIIYTSSNILNKKIRLSLIATYINNTVSPNTISTPVLLNPSPYINCNYFERDPNNKTTTTKAPNSTTTQAPNSTTTQAPNTTATTTLNNSPQINLTYISPNTLSFSFSNFTPALVPAPSGGFPLGTPPDPRFIVYFGNSSLPFNSTNYETLAGVMTYIADDGIIGTDLVGGIYYAVVGFNGTTRVWSNVLTFTQVFPTTIPITGTFTNIISPDGQGLYRIDLTFSDPVIRITQINWETQDGSITGVIVLDDMDFTTPIMPDSKLNGQPHDYSPMLIEKTGDFTSGFSFALINAGNPGPIQNIVITAEVDVFLKQFTGTFDWPTATTTAPTTESPTTAAPTTVAPTTEAPTTTGPSIILTSPSSGNLTFAASGFAPVPPPGAPYPNWAPANPLFEGYASNTSFVNTDFANQTLFNYFTADGDQGSIFQGGTFFVIVGYTGSGTPVPVISNVIECTA